MKRTRKAHDVAPAKTAAAPLSMRSTTKSRNAFAPPRTARGSVLERIRNDYDQCSKLGIDYRHKHRELLEMYMTINKVMYLWQTQSTTDHTMTNDLLRIIDKANIMSEEDLSGYRRTQEEVMRQLYEKNLEIDKAFFNKDNALFNDLTEEQQRDVLTNKRARYDFIKQRLQKMGALDKAEHATPDARMSRYAVTFSNAYFGDSVSVPDASVWTSDDLFKFSELLQAFVPSATSSGDATAYIAPVDTGGEMTTDRGIRNASGLLRIVPLALTTCTYLTLSSTSSPGAVSPPVSTTYTEDPVAMLNIHPMLGEDLTRSEYTLLQDWLDVVQELFEMNIDRLYVRQASTTTLADTNYNRGDLLVDADDRVLPIVPQHMYDDDTLSDDNLTQECAVCNNIAMDAITVYSLHKDYRTSEDDLYTTAPAVSALYTRIVGAGKYRCDALANLVWVACVTEGMVYPVVPTLSFMSGLSGTVMTSKQLKYWYDKSTLEQHVNRWSKALPVDDVHKHDVTKCTADTLLMAIDDNDTDDTHVDWLDAFARDCRACVHSSALVADSGYGETADVAQNEYALGVTQVATINRMTNFDTYLKWLFVVACDGTDSTAFRSSRENVDERWKELSTQHETNVYTFDARHDPVHTNRLLAVYLQLHKMRINPFVDQPRMENHSGATFRDIQNALITQVGLLQLAVDAHAHNRQTYEADDRNARHHKHGGDGNRDSDRTHTDDTRSDDGSVTGDSRDEDSRSSNGDSLHEEEDSRSGDSREDSSSASEDDRDHSANTSARRASYPISKVLDQYLTDRKGVDTRLDNARNVMQASGSTVFSFTWRTFRNVFGVPLLHVWRRDYQPAYVTRDLCQTLFLDLLVLEYDGKTEAPASTDSVSTAHVLSVVRELQTAAYSDDGCSACHVHLLRLLLANLGVWQMDVGATTEEGRNEIIEDTERHLDTCFKDRYHAFHERLTQDDIKCGHPSPLLLCVRYHRLEGGRRDALQDTFQRAYDDAVTRIRHPYYLATLLKFRGVFCAHPKQYELLYVLWQPISGAKWADHTRLASTVLEYAVAYNMRNYPTLYVNMSYVQELSRTMSIVERVTSLDTDTDVTRVHKMMHDAHLGRVLADDDDGRDSDTTRDVREQVAHTRRRADRMR